LASDNFIDYVKLFLRSGAGGAGSRHFFRAKGLPNGGPDGGDGGKGGDVVLKANSQLWTLLHLRYTKHLFAGDGLNGQASQMTGADGDRRVIEVPLGTVVRDFETHEIVGQVTEHDQEVVLVKGGRGGKGNLHFATATNQAPNHAQPGGASTEGWFVFELKLLADVGLVGFPNAGKSTLLSVISAAKPKIADYAFTTLTPNLGVVEYRNYKSFVMADIPGIIEGASEGKGLGIRFLKHIERNSILLYLIPADADDLAKEYDILRNELATFNEELAAKPSIIGISKIDIADEEILASYKGLFPGHTVVFFSSATGKGLMELKDSLWTLLQTANA